MEIHIEEAAKDDVEKVSAIASNIERTNLIDIADVETDINTMEVVVKLDRRKMERKGITPEDVLRKLNKSKGIKGLAEMRDANIVIKCDEPSYKKLQRISEDTKQSPIKGVEGINRAVIRKVSGLYIVYTEGSNLEKVLEIAHVDKKQDHRPTASLEIFEVLGVEAARNSIINEATKTLEEQGLTVDIQAHHARLRPDDQRRRCEGHRQARHIREEVERAREGGVRDHFDAPAARRHHGRGRHAGGRRGKHYSRPASYSRHWRSKPGLVTDTRRRGEKK